ncbi:hypothetical protein TNCV_1476411 [Trichonephila clavipes]|nr:hypothetical protein TNCV_1476411 [Trichonephila clavipes]
MATHESIEAVPWMKKKNDAGFIPILKIMGIKISPEAHAFAVKRANIWIERSEIRGSDASIEARAVRLEERTSKNAFYEVEEGPL